MKREGELQRKREKEIKKRNKREGGKKRGRLHSEKLRNNIKIHCKTILFHILLNSIGNDICYSKKNRWWKERGK